MFNVGVAGFVAIGAYASALITTPDEPARLGGFGLPIFFGRFRWLAYSRITNACRIGRRFGCLFRNAGPGPEQAQSARDEVEISGHQAMPPLAAMSCGSRNP